VLILPKSHIDRACLHKECWQCTCILRMSVSSQSVENSTVLVVVVTLPCVRVVTRKVVDKIVPVVPKAVPPGSGPPLEIWVHPGTRGYGNSCFLGVSKRLVAVRWQATRQVEWRMLRRLIVLIYAYEPELTRKTIRLMVPAEPSDMPTVGNRAFWCCTHLRSVVMPDGITEIGIDAFYNCSKLEFVAIPDSVVTLHPAAFMACSGLTSVKIGSSVSTIPSNTFSDCKRLTFVKLPNSVKHIGIKAWLNCQSLISVVMPNALISMDQSSFAQCPRLSLVEFPKKLDSTSSFEHLFGVGVTVSRR
jgi:hypothetical protein